MAHEFRKAAVSKSRSKRLGFLDAIEESHKAELHALSSLGSSSFDSLLAYLIEASPPPSPPAKDLVLEHSTTVEMCTKSSVRKSTGIVSSGVQRVRRKSSKSIFGEHGDTSHTYVPDTRPEPRKAERMTCDETIYVDTSAFEEWLEQVPAPISRLANLESATDRTSDKQCESGESDRTSIKRSTNMQVSVLRARAAALHPVVQTRSGLGITDVSESTSVCKMSHNPPHAD